MPARGMVALVTTKAKTATVALAGISNHALAAADLPSVLTLLQWGSNKTDQGTFLVNERTAACIAQQVAAGTYERVLIDFEHNSVKGHPNYQPPPRHHAGVGDVACSADRGLGLANVGWTPSGQTHGKDYPDLSPVLSYDARTMEVVGLNSVALVPNGGVIDLSFFNAHAPEANQKEETTMDPKLQELVNAVAALSASIDALKTDVATLKTGQAALSATPPGLTELKTQFAAFDAKVIAAERTAILEGAAREGKVVALQADALAKLSPDDLRAHVKALPVTVPLQAKTPDTDKGGQGTAVLSAVQKTIAAQLGIKDAATVFLKAAAALVLACSLVTPAFATAALTANRGTDSRPGIGVRLQLAPSVEIFRGAMVAITNGLAVPAFDFPYYRVVGAAQDYAKSGASDTVYVVVSRGVFRWANDGSFTNSDRGSFCYSKNDQAVDSSGNTTNDIIAGMIIDVDATGVWVDTGTWPSAGAYSVTSISDSGNAAITGNGTIGGTLAVTGAQTNSGALGVTGNGVIGGTLRVVGAQTNQGAIGVTGNAVVGGTVVSVGTITAPTLYLGTNGYLTVFGTTLVFVAPDATNVLDAAVHTP